MTDRDPFSPLNEQEERLASGDAHQQDAMPAHQQDAMGDDEIIRPVPQYATPLLQVLGRKPSAVHWYCDADGNNDFASVRFDDANGKTYRPYCYVRSATGEEWKARSVPAPRPLFNLNKLAARPNAPVLVVEGEKCVRAAEKMFVNWVVVTSWGGAKQAAKTDWSPLLNRQVVIWPDADEVGRS
jgi:putative DNA primase/helicase